MLSTFPSIDTAVDNIKISQGLEKIARVMDRGTLIRSYQAATWASFSTRGTSSTGITGYAPPQIGGRSTWARSSRARLAPRIPTCPPSSTGQNMEIGAEADALKAFHTRRLPRN